ncbi:hypothetical protein C8R48DRAFT_678829 [Suillus tomentosus]|nr:hypothetical protein C8R48DRAFT_678829 [Suillus tomentosus]
MPSWQTQTEALPTQHAGTERFDMSWNFEDDQVPTVERPNDTPSADPHVLSQVFDMCWDTEVNPAATGPAEAAVPLKAGEYNLCWNAKEGLPKVDVALIHQPDIQENETIAIAIPGGAGQYDMCWNDRASAEAMEFIGDFDMCWGDSALAGDDHLESGSIAAPVINLINAADTPAPYDLCFENISPATSPAPRDGSPSQTVEAGEELLRRANSRLENINAAMRDDRREGCKDLLDANQDLIADYQHARDQFVAASDDVAKLQHLMNMHREIDDPLHILLLAMRKMGRGHSPIHPLSILLLVPLAGALESERAADLVALVFLGDRSFTAGDLSLVASDFFGNWSFTAGEGNRSFSAGDLALVVGNFLSNWSFSAGNIFLVALVVLVDRGCDGFCYKALALPLRLYQDL